MEEYCRLKLLMQFKGIYESLSLRRQERSQAEEEVEKLRKWWKYFKSSERNVKRQLEDLKQQLERVVAEYKTRIEEEKNEK